MRNSLLVECLCAEDVTGLEHNTEVSDSVHFRVSRMVGEHSIDLRRCVVRHAGGIGRENVGMSNEKKDEKSFRRKPEVSRGRLIRSGLVGP